MPPNLIQPREENGIERIRNLKKPERTSCGDAMGLVAATNRTSILCCAEDEGTVNIALPMTRRGRYPELIWKNYIPCP
ncbi:hypothetical protein CORC01_14305 [Colletotrichum orchidophilum]|uniref:Uncharacterized protein n=1 Tax=Colletotrichum orchidophilum TaxID=1209926 RepID=A0A1G4AMJ6_9PEZI|nr:uncharacterized protein CORC01_14305 [Colletotrichum orchidophilum]OHE90394.1 hypothetical protein CORC01_14305 [Colletotrichum orchidophilum]